jgi:hypothetical protein
METQSKISAALSLPSFFLFRDVFFVLADFLTNFFFGLVSNASVTIDFIMHKSYIHITHALSPKG